MSLKLDPVPRTRIYFLVPAFISAKLGELQNSPPGWPQYGWAHPHILVIAPTRELAHQIYEEAEKFGQGAGLRTCEIFGGEGNSNGQKWALQEKNPHCVGRRFCLFFCLLLFEGMWESSREGENVVVVIGGVRVSFWDLKERFISRLW